MNIWLQLFLNFQKRVSGPHNFICWLKDKFEKLEILIHFNVINIGQSSLGGEEYTVSFCNLNNNGFD